MASYFAGRNPLTVAEGFRLVCHCHRWPAILGARLQLMRLPAAIGRSARPSAAPTASPDESCKGTAAMPPCRRIAPHRSPSTAEAVIRGKSSSRQCRLNATCRESCRREGPGIESENRSLASHSCYLPPRPHLSDFGSHPSRVAIAIASLRLGHDIVVRWRRE